MTVDYRYVILFSDLQSRSLGQLPVEVDWEPAREWALLNAFRQSPDQVAMLPAGDVRMEPLWHSKAGQPHVAGVRSLLQVDGRTLTDEFTLRLFQDAAEEAAETLVAGGRLQRGDRFLYEVCAYPLSRAATLPSPASRFVAEEVVEPLPLKKSAIGPLLESAVMVGPSDPLDVPVFIAQSILDEIVEQTEEAGPVETGSFLIGEIHRDIERPHTIFLKINAQVPAMHTEAGSKRLKLTPESFSGMDAVIRLRDRGELSLGWAHSHPQRYWCLECPAERRETCPLQARGGWFSRDDRAVQRTAFPRAYSFALLASHAESGVEFAAFGWRRGLIERRGFHVTEATRPIAFANVVPNQEESAHASSCSH